MKTIKTIALLLFALNTMILAQPYTLRIAFIGNSITNGYLGDQSYPQACGALLGDHYEIKNYGIGGATLLKKGDLPYWEETAFLNAMDFQPHIIVILLGTNDSKPQNWQVKDEFVSDYMDFIAEFRAQCDHPQIYVGNPPPVFQEGLDINAQIIREEIVPLMDSIRTLTHTFPIDFYAGMLEHGDLFPDAIHPDADGYAIMAQTAADSILAGPSGFIRLFSYKPAIVEQGDMATLFWETTTGSQVTLNGLDTAETDSSFIYLSEETSYTLIASGETSDTVTVTVPYLPSGNIKTFIASPPFLDIGSGASAELSWTASNGSVLWLDEALVELKDSKIVTPEATTTYTLIAGGVDADTSKVTVWVLPPDSINRALNHPMTASSTERGFDLESAVDGDLSTLWQSAGVNTEWINVDLEKEFDINKIIIHWSENYATLFHIQGMDENGAVVTLFSETNGDGGTDIITGLSGTARNIRLLCIKNNGNGCAIQELEVYYTPGQSSTIFNADTKPEQFMLNQNYPNPFNPVTQINYTLPRASEVSLIVYNMLGQQIESLVKGTQNAGIHTVHFDGTGLNSGLYVIVLKANGST
ncbi:GDSL-type esterase/lipase family protein, partial [bacterium]